MPHRDLEITLNLAFKRSPQQRAMNFIPCELVGLALLDNHAAIRCVASPRRPDMERLRRELTEVLVDSTDAVEFRNRITERENPSPRLGYPAPYYSAAVFHVAEALEKGASSGANVRGCYLSRARRARAVFFLKQQQDPTYRISIELHFPTVFQGRRRQTGAGQTDRTMWMMKAGGSGRIRQSGWMTYASKSERNSSSGAVIDPLVGRAQRS